MTKQEILKLIKWDNETKTLTIGNWTPEELELDLSITVKQGIKGNVSMQNIGGFNSQWNIGGTNLQRDIGGNNDQWNIGSYNIQRNIGSYNDQGSINGHSKNSKHWVQGNIKTTNVDCTDGVWLHSITKKTKGNLSFIIGTHKNGEKVYLVKTPTISYHSWASMEAAKRGWKNKRDRLIEGVKDFVKECKKTGKISIKDFREATGSCEAGTRVWLKRANIEHKEDLSDVYDFDYAVKKFKEFPMNEVSGILELMEDGE